MLSVDVATPTVLSSTTKTQLNGGNDVVLPAWAKGILAVVPFLGNGGTTVAETVLAKLSIESSELNIAPYEIPFNPIGGGLGAASGPLQSEYTKYPLNLACQGGERLKVYGTGLINNTIEPFAGAMLVLSDQPPGRPQTKAKLGTLTTAGLVNVEKKGSNIELSGGRRITQVWGMVAPTGVIVTVEGCTGFFRLSSADFINATPLRFPFQTFGGGAGAAINVAIDGISRYNVDIPYNPRCTIEDYLTLVDTLTTAPNFLAGVLYE